MARGPSGVYYEEIVAVRFPRAETSDAWIERMNRSDAAPLCACGCGRHVVIRAKHRSMGVRPLRAEPLQPVAQARVSIEAAQVCLEHAGQELMGLGR